MPFADDGVGFPMPYLRIGLGYGGPQVDTDPIRDELPLNRLAPLLVSLTVTNTKVLSK